MLYILPTSFIIDKIFIVMDTIVFTELSLLNRYKKDLSNKVLKGKRKDLYSLYNVPASLLT